MNGDDEESQDPKRKLILRLNELLLRLSEKPERASPSPVKTFLNSPFCITVIGGIVIAALSPLLGAILAQQVEARRIAERKEQLANEFAKDLPLIINVAARFKNRELWLDKAGGRKGDVRYSDGRSFTETRDYYERLVDQYHSLRPAAAFCNQIIASFNSTNVNLLAQDLNSNISSIINSTDTGQVQIAFSQASSNYQGLTLAMFSELNNKKPMKGKKRNADESVR
jgi:hypothetical protein